MINSYSVKELPLLLEAVENLLDLLNSLRISESNRLKPLLVAVNSTINVYNRIDNSRTLSITLSGRIFYYVLS